MTGCTVSRYGQFETSPEMIEQELRPGVCEHRQTDIRRIIVLITQVDREIQATSAVYIFVDQVGIIF